MQSYFHMLEKRRIVTAKNGASTGRVLVCVRGNNIHTLCVCVCMCCTNEANLLL